MRTSLLMNALKYHKGLEVLVAKRNSIRNTDPNQASGWVNDKLRAEPVGNLPPAKGLSQLLARDVKRCGWDGRLAPRSESVLARLCGRIATIQVFRPQQSQRCSFFFSPSLYIHM